MKSFFGALFLIVGLANPAQSVIILSDALGDLPESSFMNLANYMSSFCVNCTNEHLLGRGLGAIDIFTEDSFAQIIESKSYVVQTLREENSPIDADEMLKAMSQLLRVLRISADLNSGIYEKALLTELVSQEKFLSLQVADEISRVTQKAQVLELESKVKLLERNGVAPTDKEVLLEMCISHKRLKSCSTQYVALLSLNRFFSQVIEQLSLGMRVGKTGSSLYGALQARLKKLESAAK